MHIRASAFQKCFRGCTPDSFLKAGKGREEWRGDGKGNGGEGRVRNGWNRGKGLLHGSWGMDVPDDDHF